MMKVKVEFELAGIEVIAVGTTRFNKDNHIDNLRLSFPSLDDNTVIDEITQEMIREEALELLEAEAANTDKSMRWSQ